MVTPEWVFINYLTGNNYVHRALEPEGPENAASAAEKDSENKKRANDSFVGPLIDSHDGVGVSNTLTNGRGDRIRTCDLLLP